jgi:TonB-linked SusC/RagA family outer membrane protein
MLCLSVPLFAQKSFTLSGTVSDEANEALPGASVYLKDRAGVGVMTDYDGKFTIEVSPGDLLIISFMGYDNVEYRVTKKEDNLKFILKETSVLVEEVVISALGTTQRKISSVGAISTIDASELQVPATSMANILGGRMAGVITMQTSGEPGKNISEFWIRGIGTFGANASALVLIDGLEGDLNSIDPADIENFAILKDASATAVYGVRGANGVVLITTKRGEEGKLKFNLRSNFTVSQLQRMPDYLRSYDYALLANEAYAVRGDQPLYSAGDMDIIQYGLDKDLFPDVDWQYETVQPVSFQETYYLSANGGGSVAKYFLSLGMSNESAAYKMAPESPYKAKTGYNTYSFRSNLDINMTKTTKVFFGVNGYLTRQSQPGITNTDYLWNSQSQITPILVPKIYSNGQFPAYGVDDNISPYVLLNYTGTASNQTNTFNVTMNVNQDLKAILEGLKIRVQGAFDTKTYFSEQRRVLPELYKASSRGVDGELQTARTVNRIAAVYGWSERDYRKYHLESTLTYDKIIDGDHRTSALVYYYMSDSKDTYDITHSGINVYSMAAIPKRYQGISSRLTYGYRDTYLIDANFGYTGSENFQKGRRFGFFPSIALGWVASNYDFVKEAIPWVTFFKIRGSYGSVGNDQISSTRFPYMTLVNENAGAGWKGTNGGITESSIGADNLVWEKALKSNIGVDAHFFKENLNLTVDFFLDQRDGIFQRRANIPDYVGLIQLPYGNVGKMKSYGSDGNISYTHKLDKNASFTLRANYTYSTNLVQNWEETTPKYDYQQISGYPNGVRRGYISMGLFRDEQDVESSPKQSFSSEVLPGDIKYKDVNGDGVINTDDRVVLSYPTYPRLMYGFGGEFRYKDFTVGALFKGTGDNEFFYVGQSVTQSGVTYNNGMGYVPFHQGETGNILSIVADQRNRWTPASYSGDPSTENPNARFPRLTYGYNANNSQLSDFWKGNKRYLRLQEVTLNYNWKNELFRRIGVSSIDLQLVGNNLYVWDKVKIYDPEQAQLNGRAYPIPRRLTFQLYLHF